MAKVWMECEERYPVYEVSETSRVCALVVEVSEAQLRQWQEAVAAWEKAQSEMAVLFKERIHG